MLFFGLVLESTCDSCMWPWEMSWRNDDIIILSMQYFDLKKRTVGTYGYEWAESGADTKRHLVLNVVKFAHGMVDPSYFSIGVKEKTNGKVGLHSY